MRVAYAQISPVVGDLKGNAAKILDAVHNGVQDFTVMLFPELALVGYPPLDLLFRQDFLRDVELTEAELIASIQTYLNSHFSAGQYHEQCVIFGSVTREIDGLLNSAVIVFANRVERRHKTLLPTYDVFDERRWFIPAKWNAPVHIGREWFGVVICEDVWDDKRSLGRDIAGPVAELAKSSLIRNLFVLNASPWHLGKNKLREDLIRSLSIRHNLTIHYVNQVAGNDSLVFDGGSFCADSEGTIIFRAPLFVPVVSIGPLSTTPKDDIANLEDALVFGIREYMRKSGFTKAVIASSGGIDSALVIWLASLAIGPKNVHTIAMPGPYSTTPSEVLARDLATNLGVSFESVSIGSAYNQLNGATEFFPVGVTTDVSRENLQARIRGLVVMTYSNRSGAIVLTTGNKSELAVGYCTLYGDMCGGLAVIADVPKTMVFKLARHANRDRANIPWTIINRAPSAELAAGQKDSDSLPPYEDLDAIIECYVDQEGSIDDMPSRISKDVVRDIVQKIDRNEYKRQQAAPSIKVTTKAFGIGRQRLITAKYAPHSA